MVDEGVLTVSEVLTEGDWRELYAEVETHLVYRDLEATSLLPTKMERKVGEHCLSPRMLRDENRTEWWKG
eukprot:15119384-Alexandrium_andersonii.AAC.1